MFTIVTIDDEPLILEVINLFLQSKGYTVQSHLSPTSIDIDWMKEHCDLLICDVQLNQHKDGLEYCTEWIRQGLHCPILIISGFMNNPNGFQQQWSFLKKPFNRRQLLAEVERLLT
jgi:DNA-binding response OmpR family regulator